MSEYLTENKLIDFCLNLWPDDNYTVNKTIKELSPSKFRPDYVNLDKKIAVEFDGYQHYTKSKVIESDKQKDQFLKSNGYKVIRWPYFIQLETRSIREFFEIDLEVNQTYPHGFIDKNCVFPADFCVSGWNRFLSDINSIKYSESIIKEIFNSIEIKIYEEDFNQSEIWSYSKEVSKLDIMFDVMSDAFGNFVNNYS